MGIEGLPDVFHEKMYNLVTMLGIVRVYLDNIFSFANDSFNEHLEKLEVVIAKLLLAN